MAEIKEKLIKRLDIVVEELEVLEQKQLEFFSTLPKERTEVTKFQKLQGGFNIESLKFKGFEFIIISNILKEEFNIDFEKELSPKALERYTQMTSQLQPLTKTDVEIPEELKKFLESNG